MIFIYIFQPPQYKLDPRLARLMGIHTQTRPVIVNAIWQYIKVSERKSGQFEPTLLVHVQVVCVVKEPFGHRSLEGWLYGRSVTVPTSTIMACGLGFSRPQLETTVFFRVLRFLPSRKFNHVNKYQSQYSSICGKRESSGRKY